MLVTYLWGWNSSKRTTPLRRAFLELQPDKRFRMPIFCETPNLSLPMLSTRIQTKIYEAKGKPNVHVLVIHPHIQTVQLNEIRECCLTLLNTASFCSKTFIVFCDLTGTYPENDNTVTRSHQINSELRKLTTQYPYNSIYVDLQQTIHSKDWTSDMNLRTAGQAKLGRTIVRTLRGTPVELFQFT